MSGSRLPLAAGTPGHPGKAHRRLAPGTSLLEAGFLLADAPRVYRPRHPERTGFYQLIDQHFYHYTLAYEERFQKRSGPLRPIVKETVEAFLDCGLLENGFARLRCPSCKGEHLLAFSCQTRNFCPSCQAKRSALFAECLEQQILQPLPHRHVVFTVPRVLRGLIERERSLLGLVARCAFDAARRALAAQAPGQSGRPGMVASIQTFGSFANFNPHIHALVTTGLLRKGGGFAQVPFPEIRLLEELFRRLVLRAFEQKERLSIDFMKKLLSWRHSGFSVYAKQKIDHKDPVQVGHIARYLTRTPVPTDAVGTTSDGLVALATPEFPGTRTTAKTFDPLEWVHALCTQIPDRRQHLVRYYGAYANRVRARYRAEEGTPGDSSTCSMDDISLQGEEDDAFTMKRKASWARLLRKLLEVDPLLCPTCRVEMSVVAIITEPRVVDRILKHVRTGRGHDPFEPRAPPAA